MSLATRRLIISITTKDKERVERKAAKAGEISTAKFVRRAALCISDAELIAAKLAAGRPQDLADGDALHKARGRKVA